MAPRGGGGMGGGGVALGLRPSQTASRLQTRHKAAPAAAAATAAAVAKSGAPARREWTAIYSRRFLTWCLLKTIVQLAVSTFSLWFILDSGFFVPGGYDATVWPKESIRWVYVIQAVFEVADLASEMWMLRMQGRGDHMPWDSVAHHVVAAAYSSYIFTTYESQDPYFMGMAAAALSCQFIGPLYTLHRLKLRHVYLSLAILVVQLGYRTPLALVSIARAVQYFFVSPLPHFFIMVTLAYLDYRWLQWAVKHHRRMRSESANKRLAANKAL